MHRAIDFERFFHALPSPYMVLDRDLRFIDMNERYLEVTERSRADLLGHYVFDVFPESGERLAAFKSAFERAVAGETNSLVQQPFSIARPASQGGGMREVWWTCHHMPIYDHAGQVIGMAQKAEDVTAQVSLERMQDYISREFDHRVKNIIATISAIARRSAQSAGSKQEFVVDFDSRLRAMGQTHQMLVDGGWTGIDLAALVQSQMNPFTKPSSQISISGPMLELSGRQAQALGMAIHELATNAAKYGALGDGGGSLQIVWTVDRQAGTFSLEWIEDGLSGVVVPRSTGFGSTIIEKVLPMELGGSVLRTFEPTGMRCTITAPIKPH